MWVVGASGDNGHESERKDLHPPCPLEMFPLRPFVIAGELSTAPTTLGTIGTGRKAGPTNISGQSGGHKLR